MQLVPPSQVERARLKRPANMTNDERGGIDLDRTTVKHHVMIGAHDQDVPFNIAPGVRSSKRTYVMCLRVKSIEQLHCEPANLATVLVTSLELGGQNRIAKANLPYGTRVLRGTRMLVLTRLNT